MQFYIKKDQKMTEDYGFFCEMDDMETSSTELEKLNREHAIMEKNKKENIYKILNEHSNERPLSFFLLCVMQEPTRFAYICIFSCLTCGLFTSGYVTSLFYK